MVNTDKKEVGFIGLGTMGVAMTAHLVQDGYTVHAFDRNEEKRTRAEENQVTVHGSLSDCIAALPTPRIIFVMVQEKEVEDLVAELAPKLKKGDCIIDGGNSFFKDSILRHQNLQDHEIDLIDCGVSGTVEGAKTGLALMVGGDEEVVRRHEHVFKALAETDGYGYVGGPGAGHFVKMVHNGIEYGMIGAISEGMSVLHEHRGGMNLNIKEAIKAYEHGSIIEGNLISWLADAYEEEGDLERFTGEVAEEDTDAHMEYLIDHNELRVLAAALTARKLTRVEPSFIGSLIEAIKKQFGADSFIIKHIANRTDTR